MEITRTPINFSYAAGKVASGAISGNFTDSNGADPGGGFAPPAVNVQWNTDGKVYVYYTTSGYQETLDWYTGGAPSGPTNFQLVVNSRSGGSSIIWSHDVGTYNYTNSFTISIGMTDTYQARTGDMYCTVNITRQGVTRSHSFYLEVIAGGI